MNDWVLLWLLMQHIADVLSIRTRTMEFCRMSISATLAFLYWLSADLKVGILTALWPSDHMACTAQKKSQPFLTLTLSGSPAWTHVWSHCCPYSVLYMCMCCYFRHPVFTVKHFINIPEEESEVLNPAKFLVKTGLWGLVHKPNGWLIGSMHPICMVTHKSVSSLE